MGSQMATRSLRHGQLQPARALPERQASGLGATRRSGEARHPQTLR